jgi:hypothetical protein
MWHSDPARQRSEMRSIHVRVEDDLYHEEG